MTFVIYKHQTLNLKCMSIFDNESNIKKDLNLTVFHEWNVNVQKMNANHELWIGFTRVNKKSDKFQYVRNFLDDTKRNGTDIFEHIHMPDIMSLYGQMLYSKRNGWSYQDLPNNNNNIIGMSIAYILQDISYIDFVTTNNEYCRLENYNRTIQKITRRIREWFDVPKDMHIKLLHRGYYNVFRQAYIFELRAFTYRTNQYMDTMLFDIELENLNMDI